MKYFVPFSQQTGENLLINGSFRIANRGTTVTDNTAQDALFDLADRWSRTVIPAAMAMPGTLTQRVIAVVPSDLLQSLTRYNLLTAGGGASPNATSHHYIEQKIESGTQRFGGNKTLVFTFWVLPDVLAACHLGVALRQNYGAGGSAEEVIHGQVLTFTGGTGWVKAQVTFQTNTLDAKTVNAGNYLSLMIGFMAGTTPALAYYDSPVAFGYDNLSTGGVSITQCKLEIGAKATPYIADEIANVLMCARYFQRFNADAKTTSFIGVGDSYDATHASILVPLIVPMYKVPTLTQRGNLAVTNAGMAAIAVTGLAVDATRSTTLRLGLTATVAAGLTAGQVAILEANADTTGDIWLDGEIT